MSMGEFVRGAVAACPCITEFHNHDGTPYHHFLVVADGKHSLLNNREVQATQTVCTVVDKLTVGIDFVSIFEETGIVE